MCNQISFIKPYFDIYAAIKDRKEMKMEDDDTGVCIAIPHAVNVPYQDLFSYLHNGKTDYIYIETIKDNKLTTGLLCTDKDRHLSDTDSCFFIGKIEGVQDGRYPESISICLRVRQLILLRFCKFVKGMIENP